MSQQIYITKPVPIHGLNTDQESTEFVREQSPWMQNCVCELTAVRKRYGYSKVGGQLTGVGMCLISFISSSGIKRDIVLTTKKAYLHIDSLSSPWQNITPIVNNEEISFSGDEKDRWSYCTVTDYTNLNGTVLVITNGKDGVFYYDGGDGSRFEPLSVLPSAYSDIKEIHEFWNHFFILNFSESGLNNIRSVRYADAGDVSKWTDGTSGWVTLTDTKGAILKAVPLGTAMIIYSESSITMCRYFGGITVFSFPTLIYETGLLDKGAVFGSTNVHFFLGTDNRIYAYYGETDLRPVGESVEKRLFGDIDISKKHLINAGIDLARHKVMFAIPTHGYDFCNYLYVFNYRNAELSWELYKFGHSVQSIGTLSNYLEWYCSTPPFYFGSDYEDEAEYHIDNIFCDESIVYCDSGYGQKGYLKTCFVSSDGYVYQMDEMLTNDDGTPIEFELHTPDMTVDKEEVFLRYQWFSFTASSDIQDSTVDVSYSTDSGASWTFIDTVKLDKDWKTYRVSLDVVSRKIRFRLVQDTLDSDIKLRGLFKTKAVIQTERD